MNTFCISIISICQRWVEAFDLMDRAMEVCREITGEREAPKLFKMLSWVKLTLGMQKWVEGLPAVTGKQENS